MRLYFLSITISILICGLNSCSGNEKSASIREYTTNSEQYRVYIINYSYHTGIVIPVNSESIDAINGLSYFRNFSFTDIGWGEEKFYQDPKDNYCMGARAILLPNSSVLRIEGYSRENFITWSNYVVQLNLSKDQYIKLLKFIDDSFTKQTGDDLIIASKKHSGDVIFFKSIYKYHLFNTCNTWIAEALKTSGLDVSPFFIITARLLFNEIKNKGRVIKESK